MRKTLFLLLSILCLSTVQASGERPVRVYADITGDLLHAGHLEFFKKAKALGDELVIGVLTDEDVESYKRTPIMSLSERVAMVRACSLVDEVIVAPPLRATEEFLQQHAIDLVVHGDDMGIEMLYDQYGTAIELGIFRLVPYTEGISTTDLIGRIQERVEE